MSRVRIALGAVKLTLVTLTVLVATGGPSATFSTAFDSGVDSTVVVTMP